MSTKLNSRRLITALVALPMALGLLLVGGAAQATNDWTLGAAPSSHSRTASSVMPGIARGALHIRWSDGRIHTVSGWVTDKRRDGQDAWLVMRYQVLLNGVWRTHVRNLVGTTQSGQTVYQENIHSRHKVRHLVSRVCTRNYKSFPNYIACAPRWS